LLPNALKDYSSSSVRRLPGAKEFVVKLSLSTRIVQNCVVLDCSGRIIFGEETARLRDTVRQLLAENRHNLVLNLSGITHVDSGGLGTLVSLYTSAKTAGGSMKLARLPRSIGDLLHITKLVTIFEIYEDEEKAVDSFEKGASA
jgi:anti-sigma B factor antagonist